MPPQRAIALLFALVTTALASADLSARGPADVAPVLPPELPWHGASETLIAPAGHRWQTPAEATGFVSSPDYAATRSWFEALAAASPELRLESIGTSGEGREILMLVRSGEQVFDPARRSRERPLVLIQAGIHPGEIDGKDAAMMLLRDLLFDVHPVDPLLESADLLVVPILNVDGHERTSTYGRINQRGPHPAGWRTNARNLNLNRDYLKADTPEIRAVLGVLERWDPELYVDIHVTDGMDHQYDVTWGGSFPLSPACGAWVHGRLEPRVNAVLEEAGHVPGPLLFSRDRTNPDAGLYHWTAAEPRFSDGYGNLRHLPTLLVENHSLKSFRRRVLGTRMFLEAVIAGVVAEHPALRRAIAADRARRDAQVALSWRVPEEEAARGFLFKGVAWQSVTSELTGGTWIRWSGEPVTKTLPLVEPSQADTIIERPAAYWIPPAWSEVIERLRLHGVRCERLREGRELQVRMYRVDAYSLGDTPYEGRVRVELDAPLDSKIRSEYFPAGSVRVSTDQPLGELAMALLEPQAPDSLFRWGFFLSILNRTEYVEPYIMEAMAPRLLAADPELAAALAAKREADPSFAADPRRILQWLYEQTPYCDPRWRLYPVAREEAPPADGESS